MPGSVGRMVLSLFLLFGLGLGLGLWTAWEVWPWVRHSDQPSELRWEDKEEYVIMIAKEYLRYGDVERAREQLALLGFADPLQAVVDLVEAGDESAPALANLAYALGSRDAALAAYLSMPSPTSTRESEPSFRLVESLDLGCGEFPQGLIMVYVQDGEGSGVPNVALKVSGPQGDDLFYTGLKPRIDVGYADFAFFTSGEYNVRVAEGISQVVRVMAKPCERGSHRAWRVVFQEED